FLENKGDRWKTLVSEDESGEVDGFLVSIDDPGSRMIGPGVAKSAAAAEALLLAQLDFYRGKSIVFLFPAKERELIDAAYRWGAKNCEMHYTQVRGEAQPVVGVVMPTFMPESA
ncbi:MAG: N-acetyltransferase, partial [Verrucomicrobiota bacterium]